MLSLSHLAVLGLSLIPAVFSSPLLPSSKRSGNFKLALNTDFPDPAFIQHTDGSWYAFGTNSNGKRIQVAHSNDFESWTLLDLEALPTLSGWETEVNHWAPDVIRRSDGNYVMYYSAEYSGGNGHHCIGIALGGTNPAGPYIPVSNTPFTCPLDQGGAIDAAGFQDSDGSRYVVYKIDGNGGDCVNGGTLATSTPIMLQPVKDDGVTAVGNPTQILDRDESEGPLIEAPYLTRDSEGTYILFYSSHCFNDPKYDVRYATASSIAGPYTKAGYSLVASTDQVSGPGGATVNSEGKMLFHGWCNGNSARCMYSAHLELAGKTVTLA
ncbi:putative endo-arabinase [Talaromyces proteolyticus]|uniref:Endo-arabinase n=1 Tax=Talaromyces proteolyticus TaxID=1131652 RepID=A0AAD4KHS9_9EURO|nr:putative endo-arabinase [Talaromyces proteolyticus]KAH8692055.1 putative endo-arabinase [Talaromyces proteolyticus]